MRFSDAQALYEHVRRYFDKNPGYHHPLLIESETITENIHNNTKSLYNKEQSDHKKKKIEVIRRTSFETMTRGFLQWLMGHGVKIDITPKFQVLIPNERPSKEFYVNFAADEAQELYNFVSRHLWTYGEPLWVMIDPDKVRDNKNTDYGNKDKTNHIQVKEITRHGQITPEFLSWLKYFGFNVKYENVR